MPGLCGWFATASVEEGRPDLDKMTAELIGVPGSATAIALTGGAALATVSRLAGAFAEGPDGVLVAVDGRPRGASRALDERVVAHGPGRAILDAYGEAGEAVVEHIRGPFALAILDPGRRRAVLAIDRMGVHSLVYAVSGGTLVFGTSADAVRRHPRVDADISPQSVYRYAVNYVSPAPHTIYDACRKLLPAHALCWRDGAVDERRYWRIPYTGALADRPEGELRERLFALLDRAVHRGLRADDGTSRVGAFLSGGLDSSAVSGVLRRARDDRVPAFTIGFADAPYDESAFARAAAEHFDLEHHVRNLTVDDAVALIPRLADAFDEPFGNSSVIPAYYCARMAADAGVGLMFAGDGGDEIFAGNARYVDQKILGLYHHLPRMLRAPMTGVLDRVPSPLAVSVLGKAQRYVRKARAPMPERMLGGGVYRPEALRDIFTDEALATIDPEEPRRLWRTHYAASGSEDMLYSMLHLDTRVTLADNDLRKVGRAMDMAGVEAAYPLLDEDLVEFAAAIPPDRLIRRFDLRHFFKRAMRGFLPDEILDKTKHGFGMPFAEWTREDPRLLDMIGDAIADQKRRGIFRPAFLDTVLETHRRTPDSAYGGIVWDILMLEQWWAHREGG